MTIHYSFRDHTFRADLSRPTDLSIRLQDGLSNPNCFWAPAPEFSPVVAGDFIGSTARGGVVNFFNVRFNPHGNGTHTECVGHIARERYVLPDCLRRFHFHAKLVSVYPQRKEDGDRVVLREQIEALLSPGEAEALIIRTQPNDLLKQSINYSGSNPPYIEAAAADYLAECGIEHLLIDLPSVDREEDGGALAAHKAFWRYPEAVRAHCTITELIYVADSIKDGFYLLHIQTAPFDLDVSPSRPTIYRIE
jgi:arylformamidase